MRAVIWTPPAMLAVGATMNVSAAARVRQRSPTHVDDRIRRKRSPFEHEHAAIGLLGVAELVEQLVLDASNGAERAGAHCEVLVDLHGPPGVLRRHARDGWVVGPDLYALIRIAADR